MLAVGSLFCARGKSSLLSKMQTALNTMGSPDADTFNESTRQGITLQYSWNSHKVALEADPLQSICCTGQKKEVAGHMYTYKYRPKNSHSGTLQAVAPMAYQPHTIVNNVGREVLLCTGDSSADSLRSLT